MIELTTLQSPCVCGRDFSWRRILEPDWEKGDSPNWLVVFGPGMGDARWESWCLFISSTPAPIDFAQWGVLLVTTETPQQQLEQTLYRDRFDCRTVRTLSDSELQIGPHFGVMPQSGTYPFTIVQVKEGEILNRFT